MPESPLPNWTDPVWSNWALVIVGIVAAWIAVGTLKDLKKQTVAAKDSADSAKKAADAAFLNAQAVINSERPWVSIFVTRKHGSYTFQAGNMGRTPAEIISYSKRRFFARPADLIGEPQYDAEKTPALTLLIPGRELGDQSLELETCNIDILISTNAAASTAVTAEKKALIFIFQIFYKDTLVQTDSSVQPYETRMCFVWTPTSIHPEVGGPAQYNRHT